MVDALGYLSEAKRHAAAKGGNAEVLEAVVQADEDLLRCLIILLGINPENEGDRNRVAAWDELTRDQQLDMAPGGAWFYCERARGSIDAALRATVGKKRAQAAVTDLQNAQGTLAALDRKLWRAKPADFPTIGRPGIGHGTVNLTCKRLNQSTVYDRRYFVAWLRAYEQRATDQLRAELSQYIRIQNAKATAIGLFCDIYDDPPARECRVMAALEVLSMVAGEAYHFLITAAVSPGGSGPAGLAALSDGWRTGVDWAMWAALRLPLCGGAV
jgi:hypothetical protein